jgi:plasmid stabilization system protein ParE
MNYEIVWEMDALDDRSQIIDFLFEMASFSVAENVDLAIKDSGESLSTFPFKGVDWRGVKRLVISTLPYQIIYTVDEVAERVFILRVLHSKKQYP